MTNADKADRLEEMAFDAGYRDHEDAAALLRECAAMMRERGAVQWHYKDGDITRTAALYEGRLLVVVGKEGRTACWAASKKHDEGSCEIFETDCSLEAAQAAAVAWVDGQDGE